MLTWIKNEMGAGNPPRYARDRLDPIRAVAEQPPLLLLNGLKIIDDRAHLFGLKDELRHVRMTSGKALRQGLGKIFDLEFARKRAEGWGGGMRARAGAADGMAAAAVGRQQGLATACRFVGAFCRNGRHQADRDQADEKRVKDRAAHG
jgi:hypothetical protein